MTIKQPIYANFSFQTETLAGQSTPSRGYEAKLTAKGPSEYIFDGTFENGKWVFTATITEPGLYQYAITYENNLGRFLNDSGRINVQPDPTAAQDGELTTHAERVLAAIEAVIESRATKDQQSYSIAGRSITRIPVAELLELRKQYRAEVADQLKKRPKAIVYVFGRR